MLKNLKFLKTHPKASRDISSRLVDKSKYRDISLEFGEMYFDGPREYGYGGYVYDGRWLSIAQEIISHYDLKPGDRVLDVGCAKGFLVRDLLFSCPGLNIFGLDVSTYAIKNCHPDVIGRLHLGNATSLPFPDNSFKLALSINTIHNLGLEDCKTAINEIQRVSPDNSFIQVDSYRNEAELAAFEDWMLTAKSYFKPEEWLEIFSSLGFTGDYDWTIVEG